MMVMVYLLALILALFSCAPKSFVPADGSAGNRTAVYEDENIRVTVRYGGWVWFPHDLPYHLTPFHVVVENRGDTPLEITYRDIVLVDSRGVQYSALDPGSAVAAVAGAPRYGFVVEFVYGTPYVGLGVGSVPYERGYGREIVSRAFIPTRLGPGNRAEGFVYFQRLPGGVEEVSLRLTYRNGEERTLSFRFRVEERDAEGGDTDWGEEDW